MIAYKSIQYMIGAINISNDITEEDINDCATVANEFSLDCSDEEIVQHSKRKESPVLLTDSEDDFVEMHAKPKISNADAKNYFQLVFSNPNVPKIICVRIVEVSLYINNFKIRNLL